MIVQAGRVAVLRWRSLRHAALVILSVAVAHETIYWSQGQTTLVPQDGAHGYWPVMLAAAALGALMLSAWSMWRMGRAAVADRDSAPLQPTAFCAEWWSIFRHLLPAVTLTYLVLENTEHLLAHGHAEGIDVFLAPGQLASFPLLVATVALFSAVGALVRWHEAVIARVAQRRQSLPRLPRPGAARLVWFERAELARSARLLFHEDLGRAPPSPSI